VNQNNQHWEESPRGVNCWAVVDHRRHLSSLGPWSLRLFPRLARAALISQVVGKSFSQKSSTLLQQGRLVFFNLLTLLELRLAPRERKVSESDHVLDLSLHSDAEEGDEVHD